MDKYRQEKLKRFRESIATKLSANDDGYVKTEDNRILFNVPWKENGDFQSDDPDCQRYLRTLNAAIFLRIKSLCERQIDSSILSHVKYPERNLYNETLTHLTHYSKISSNTCLGFDSFIEQNHSFKQWLSLANTDEHYPLLVIGNRASGKTLLCTKLVQYLLNTLGKSAQCILRYFNLTSRSRNMTEIFNSICTQMKALQNVPSCVNDPKSNNVDYYQSVLKSLSNNNRPIIIMIDGIEEASPPSQYMSSIAYYQALFQLMPSKVFHSFSLINRTDFHAFKRLHSTVGLSRRAKKKRLHSIF